MMTCTGCGKTDGNVDFWERGDQWWHLSCHLAALSREVELLERPIKERHDGPNTRNPGRRETTS